MIAGIFHDGSGLGNQLHRYIAVRCLALDKGYDFGMFHPEKFKGTDLLTLDMGKPLESLRNTFIEERIDSPNGTDIRPYDAKIALVEDSTLLDGEFQDERYFKHHLSEIREWLKIEPLQIGEDTCVINFRGGEYKNHPDLFLNKEYWENAVSHMKRKGVKHFVVVTDDIPEAQKCFPDFPVTHNLALDWRMIRYAPWLILSNSSFAILPAWLNENVKEVVAPKFWARHNLGFWALPQNEYTGWTYL